MTRMPRVLDIAAVVSAIALCFIAIGCFASPAIDPRQQFISLSAGCHLSIIYARGADARLLVFNDSSYGPYLGSIIGFAEDPNPPVVSGVGDVAGVYYRLIRWPNGNVLWTLSLCLLYPLIVSALLPAVWLVRRSRRSRADSSDCPQLPADR